MAGGGGAAGGSVLELVVCGNVCGVMMTSSRSIWPAGMVGGGWDGTGKMSYVMELDLRRRGTADEMDRMVEKSATFLQVADWLHSYVVKEHADNEALRTKWMTSDDRMAAHTGWALTTGRVAKSTEGLDLAALLDRIEKEMGSPPPKCNGR